MMAAARKMLSFLVNKHHGVTLVGNDAYITVPVLSSALSKMWRAAL